MPRTLTQEEAQAVVANSKTMNVIHDNQDVTAFIILEGKLKEILQMRCHPQTVVDELGSQVAIKYDARDGTYQLMMRPVERAARGAGDAAGKLTKEQKAKKLARRARNMKNSLKSRNMQDS